MFDLSQKNNKFILGGFTIIVLIVLFYLHDFYTKKLIHSELKKIAKSKKKNIIKNLKIKQKKFTELENTHDMENIDKELEQHDMDSYIDPGAQFNEDDNSHNNSQASSRLNSSNIMMRDIINGI